MAYMAFKLEAAREIIRNCEEIQKSYESAFTKSEEQRSAYRQLKELILDDPYLDRKDEKNNLNNLNKLKQAKTS